MGAVGPGSRSAYASEQREFDGGGSRFAVGDTLMARITPCLENGKIARFAGQPGEIAHGSTEFIVIRGRDGVSETDYAYYLAKWEGVSGYAISQMTGTSGRQRVPPEALDHLDVPLPPLPEQRAIAHILGTLDDKIELNRRMSETLEAIARAIFKSWFVDFDPVRAKAESRDPGLPQPLADLFPGRLVDSELGEIPEGWELAMFADITELLRDQVNPLDYPDTRFRHFSIPAFDEGQWPKEELGEAIKSQKSRVPPGVVLLSKLNPEIERVWLVDVKVDDEAVCSTEFLVLRPRAPFGRGFAYCLARSPLFRQGVEGLVTGTSKSHQRAQGASVLALPAVRPSASIAQAFERQAEPLLTRSLGCRRESGTLAALRDALLPKLISGELRVKDAERFVAQTL
jgi:type I restriction enzyme S subunit